MCAKSWSQRNAPAACGSGAMRFGRFSLPRLQEIRACGFAALKAGDGEAARESVEEFPRVGLLDVARAVVILLANAGDIRGVGDTLAKRGRWRGTAMQH